MSAEASCTHMYSVAHSILLMVCSTNLRLVLRLFPKSYLIVLSLMYKYYYAITSSERE